MGFRLTAKLPLCVTKPNCRRSLEQKDISIKVQYQQFLVLELKIKDALNFQVQHILAFLENNPNNFLYVNKVQSLSFPVIFVSILH